MTWRQSKITFANIVWSLIWVFIVNQCPFTGTQGTNGLTISLSYLHDVSWFITTFNTTAFFPFLFLSGGKCGLYKFCSCMSVSDIAPRGICDTKDYFRLHQIRFTTWTQWVHEWTQYVACKFNETPFGCLTVTLHMTHFSHSLMNASKWNLLL